MGAQNANILNVINGNELILDESSNDSNLGNQLSNFEIIRFYDFIGSNQEFRWSLAQVRSLLNKKIYLMQKISGPFNPQIIQIYIEQFKFLNQLNNPFIMKYFSIFQDNNNDVYLIKEFMDTDLGNFLKTHQNYNSKINEEEIWNILLQCLLGLNYLHKQNYSNLCIKLTNIFINDERNVKICVFNSFPNSNDLNYNIKDDILNLGNYFSKGLISNNYSKELIEILNIMINPNQNQRPDSIFLYNMALQFYVENYAKNSSILSVIQCLFSYQNFNQLLSENN